VGVGSANDYGDGFQIVKKNLQKMDQNVCGKRFGQNLQNTLKVLSDNTLCPTHPLTPSLATHLFSCGNKYWLYLRNDL